MVGNLLPSSTSTIQIWVVASRKYGISALISQTSFRGETSAGGVAKCRLFSQAKLSNKDCDLFSLPENNRENVLNDSHLGS